METGIHELTAAYALDALDPEERAEYESHLRECEACQDELASLAGVTEALAVAASGPAPRPELRDRILAAAREEPQTVVPFEPRHRRVLPAIAAVAAVAAVVALVLGLWSAQLSSDLDQTRSELAQAQALGQVLADPDARMVALQSGGGRLVVDSEGRAVLVADQLYPVGTEKTYELWILPGGDLDAANPAGLYAGREGTDIVTVDGTVRAGDVVAVTIEDEGGAETPTLPPVVASEPV